jgi:hypothetical protein
MNKSRFVLIATAAALAGAASGWAAGQSSSANYKIPQSTLNNGIGNISSANYKLSSSLGDPFFTGPSSSTNYKLSHGFWPSGAAAAPLFMNAVSRKPHGGAGTFDLPLAP